MRHRGGAVGHSSTRDATQCLLNDRDKLDNEPFVLEHDHEPHAKNAEENDNGDISMDESNDSVSGEGSDSKDDEDSDVGDAPLDETSGQLINDELGDEMEEQYGYSGLDQVLDSDEDGQMFGEEDRMDAEGELSDIEYGAETFEVNIQNSLHPTQYYSYRIEQVALYSLARPCISQHRNNVFSQILT